MSKRRSGEVKRRAFVIQTAWRWCEPCQKWSGARWRVCRKCGGAVRLRVRSCGGMLEGQRGAL